MNSKDLLLQVKQDYKRLTGNREQLGELTAEEIKNRIDKIVRKRK